MNTASKVLKYQVRDLLRSRWLIGYALFFALATDALVRLEGNGERALLGLVSVTLFVVPLVAVVFGTVYVYHAREFTEMLLAQPVARRQLFGGLYGGLAGSLSMAFVLGIGTPLLLEGVGTSATRAPLLVLFAAGIALTCTFSALAFLIALGTESGLKGLGLAIATWLGATVLYDGVVLVCVMVLGDYSIERPLLALMFFNPVDLARVLLLLQFDVAALLGYTAAVFRDFFSGVGGGLIALFALVMWIVGPVALSVRVFQRKDF